MLQHVMKGDVQLRVHANLGGCGCASYGGGPSFNRDDNFSHSLPCIPRLLYDSSGLKLILIPTLDSMAVNFMDEWL